MTASDRGGPKEPRDGPNADVVSSPDARILRRTMREAVSMSPGAFLTTVAEIDARSSDHWEDELRSSTWAVVQRGDEVFGIAAAKLPSDDDGYIRHSQTARFIESVWIAPSMRGNGYGERLIKYLFDTECKKSADVDRFFVWVFIENTTAIRMYERMGFEHPENREQQSQRADGTRVDEVQYQLLFDSLLAAAAELNENSAAREEDWIRYGVRYRLLGENPRDRGLDT